MGLRDVFRSRSVDDGHAIERSAVDPTEEAPFTPLTGTWYHGAPQDGEGPQRRLFFTAAGTVTEQVTVDEPEPLVNQGDWTSVGSFLVQRRFERPTIYTVLDSSADRFQARCTDAGAGVTLTYAFRPATD